MTIKVVFDASPLCTHNYEVWIMFPDGATCLPVDCCFSETLL